MIQEISFALLVVLFLYREYSNQQVQKDLLNRLMSRDLADYKAIKSPAPKGANFVKRGIEEHYNMMKAGDKM